MAAFKNVDIIPSKQNALLDFGFLDWEVIWTLLFLLSLAIVSITRLCIIWNCGKKLYKNGLCHVLSWTLRNVSKDVTLYHLFIYLHFARKDRANVILPSLYKKLIGHVQKLTWFEEETWSKLETNGVMLKKRAWIQINCECIPLCLSWF